MLHNKNFETRVVNWKACRLHFRQFKLLPGRGVLQLPQFSFWICLYWNFDVATMFFGKIWKLSTPNLRTWPHVFQLCVISPSQFAGHVSVIFRVQYVLVLQNQTSNALTSLFRTYLATMPSHLPRSIPWLIFLSDDRLHVNKRNERKTCKRFQVRQTEYRHYR